MSKSLAYVDTIFFDEDQTILDWRTYKEAVINLSAFELSSCLGKSVGSIRKRIHKIYEKNGYDYYNLFDDLLKGLKIRVDDRIYDRIKSAGIVAYARAELDFLNPYPDIPLVLRDLKNDGYKLGIISDAPSLEGWKRLRKTNLNKFFEDNLVYIGMGLKETKEPFKLMMQENKFTPERLLMVGDNPKSDIKPANELGIRTALVKYGQVFNIDNNDPLQQPDYSVVSLWELKYLLDKSRGIDTAKYI